MRAIQLAAFVAIGFVASLGEATDVAFKLDVENFAAVSETTLIRPPAIAISDCVWAAPGIEQSTRTLLPPRKFDFAAPPRLRIVHSMDDAGPEWLDDAAWPLTRELYGLGLPPFDEWDGRQQFVFGKCVLQR